MAKLEIEFEITGVKLRIKGESDDVVARAAHVQRQLQAAVQSLGNVGDGALSTTTPLPPPITLPPAATSNGGVAETNGRKRGRRSGGGGSIKSAEPIELNHNAETYGFPSESWNGATKAMWLLYVLEKQANLQEASTGVLVETFNKYFRRFGALRSQRVSRDLGTAQAERRVVANNANQNPPTWYLLDSGKKEIEALVKESLAAPAVQ